MRQSPLVVPLLLSLIFTGCGDGGDDDDGGGANATYGTCDLRDDRHTCIEATSNARNIENQREGCLDAGGSWSDDACPTQELLGCCEYTFGMEFRECFYTGTSRTDPEADCLGMFEDAEWFPAQP